MKAYLDCYKNNKKDFDWMAFFDFDEFLVLKKDKDIHSYLEKFDDFNCIKINWMIYDDNDIVVGDERPLNERFTRPMEYDKKVGFNFPQNNHVKSIIRCSVDKFRAGGLPHVPIVVDKICNADGKNAEYSPFEPYTFENAYLKHFSTKTIDEFVHNKMVRGLGDRTLKEYMGIVPINEFFKVNKMSSEKNEYLVKNGFDVSCIKPKNDVKIFICTHKDFDKVVTNDDVYEIIDIRENEIKERNGLDDKFYSELISYYNVSKRTDLPKYVGFCHYRRYFSFMDDVPNMDEKFSRSDAIIAKPIEHTASIKKQYSVYHNIEDLYIIGGILADKYPQYQWTWHNFINGTFFIPYNMFIMRREDFKKYIEFMFNILDEYVKIVGTDISKRIENNKDKYIKKYYPNNTPEYQCRIGGYLGERLTNVFIIKNFNRVTAYPVKITEKKYQLKDENN